MVNNESKEVDKIATLEKSFCNELTSFELYSVQPMHKHNRKIRGNFFTYERFKQR